ncbi:MAG: fatty acyl-AMP ligase, partial [Firmicutes bacterium]|nr:fatty acyl-AMP ligase [Bacillota bacterium]
DVDGDKTAYIFLEHSINDDLSEHKITYKQLEKKACILSFFLQQHEGYGERAILLYPPGIDYIVAFFACLRAGVLAVPSYPPYSKKVFSQFSSIVKDARPKFIITNKLMVGILKSQFDKDIGFSNIIWVTTDDLNDEELYNFKTTPNKIAFLQYTSGSTSQPKGVMITHDNLLHNLFAIHQSFQHDSESTGVIWLPPYHDMGLIGGILQPLYAGFTVVLMSPLDFLKKPIRWLRAITSYRANTSGGPNFAYELCIRKITREQKQGLDLSSWDLAFNGAEVVQASTMDRFINEFGDCGFKPEAFYPCYGLAESTLIVTAGKKGKPFKTIFFDHQSTPSKVEPKDAYGSGLHKKYVSCGTSMYPGEVIIVDPDSNRKMDEEFIGEIWVRGPSVASGYWNNKEETERVFNAHLADTGEGPYLKTSDMGFTYNGELFVVGRINDIIVRGKNYYPYDVEKIAESCHPALRIGCNALFSVNDINDVKIVLVQEIRYSHDGDIKPEDIIDSIRNSVALSQQLHINDIVLIKQNTIPKTTSGKIRRNECRKQYINNELNIAFENPG